MVYVDVKHHVYLLTYEQWIRTKTLHDQQILQVLARTQNWLKRDSIRNTGVRKNRQSDLKHATADQHGNTGGQEIGPYRWTINTTDKNTVNRDRKHGLPKCRSVTEQQNNNNWQTKSDPPTATKPTAHTIHDVQIQHGRKDLCKWFYNKRTRWTSRYIQAAKSRHSYTQTMDLSIYL